MLCPKCKHRETQVVDSRDTHEGVRRRRECLACKYRFTTYERTEAPHVVVIKKNGEQERFNPEKIRRGVSISCKNRPISALQIDSLVAAVEQRVYQTGKDEINSSTIGDFVRDVLKEIDEIAYIRFASVYEAFSQIEQFNQVIGALPNHPKETPNA